MLGYALLAPGERLLSRRLHRLLLRGLQRVEELAADQEQAFSRMRAIAKSLRAVLLLEPSFARVSHHDRKMGRLVMATLKDRDR